MPNTQSQDNLLIPLDVELKRTLRANQRMGNKGIHCQGALIKGVHYDATMLNQPPHNHDG